MTQHGDTWVCLLRGINVGGHKKVPMAELRELCRVLELRNVATYLQSGNVVCESKHPDASSVATLLEQGIEERFGFPVSTIVRKKDDYLKALEKNPFVENSTLDPKKLLVVFLQGAPSSAQVDRLAALESGSDELAVVGDSVFLHCPQGYGRTKLSNNVFERHLDTVATTRNWKTVNALAKMLQDR